MSDQARDGGSVRSPTQAEMLSRLLRAFGADLRVSCPGVITKWEPNLQRANVKPLVKQAYLDEDSNRQIESWPVIPGVAVEFPGMGDVRITWPLSDGTLVIEGQTVPATIGRLTFADFSIEKWLTGNGSEVDPEIDHYHAPIDAIFTPGLRPFGAPLSVVPTDHATMGFDTGVQLHFHRQIIAAGTEAGNDFVALAQKVLTQLTNIQTYINGHTHPYLNATAPATTSAPTDPMDDPTSVAATQFKAK